MADGRLDEAYTLAIRDDVRQHRRGQKLISRLVNHLLQRGQAHVEQRQFEPGLADYDRAARLGGNQPRMEKLRGDALAALDSQRREQQRRGELLIAARRHIDRGELSLGAQIVDKLEKNDVAIGKLSDEIAVKRASVQAALKRAEQAAAQEAYPIAIPALREVRRIQPDNLQLAELAEKITQAVLTQVRGAIGQGRLSLAASHLDQLLPFAEDHPDVIELGSVLEQCQVASGWLEDGNVHEARQTLQRVARILPGASWIQQAIQRAEEASASLEAIRGGPLGRVASRHAGNAGGRLPAPRNPEVGRRGGRRSPFSPPNGNSLMNVESLPTQFLLQVDGAGGYLVARGRRTTIGPISSSRHPHVGLLAPADLPVVSIERLDDDYFLRSDGSVRVNDKLVSDKLLNHGDRIALRPRLGIRFLIPNAASTSAVLELSGARLPRQDVRRIILLDESIVLGSDRTAHIAVSGLQESIVLHLRHGTLLARHSATTQDNDSPIQSSSAIVMDRPVQIGPISIVLTELR